MLFAATWMDPKSVILSEASQTEEENIIWHPSYVESKKKSCKNRKRLTSFDNKFMALLGKDRGWDRELEMSMYTLLYLKWITNKDLLYSTVNCSVLCGSLDWKEVWGKNGYMYMYGWVPLSQHYVNWLYPNAK